MASRSETNNESADKSLIATTNMETNSSGGKPAYLCVASVAKMDGEGGQVKPMPNQQSDRTAGLNTIEPEPEKTDASLESESDRAKPVDSKGNQLTEYNKEESMVDEVVERNNQVKEITPTTSDVSESSESPDDVSESKTEVSIPPPLVQTQTVASAIGDFEDDIPIVPVQGHPTQPKKLDTSPNFIDSFAKWLADCEGSSTKPAKKVDRRQQRHTASTTNYVPRNLSAENIGSSEPQKEIDLSDKESSVPKFERVQSISGNVEVSKSSAPGEEESDDAMSFEDAEPSESDGVSKVTELTKSVNDVPCVTSSQPVLFQEESLQSAPKDSESVLEGSSIESESISGTSESLSSVNKIVQEEDGEARECEMTIDEKEEEEEKEGEEGDEKETPEGEEEIEDETGELNEDKENLDEEARDSLGKLEESTPKKKKTRRGSIGFGVIPSGQDALIMGQPGGKFPPEKLFEYQWPQDKGDFFMLQEQISEYLGVKSFKRKYPDLPRKTVDIMERNFLKDKGIVTEMQCDLGLTAVRSEDVLDLMQRDYEEKYKEYTLVLQEREKQKMKEKTKGYEQFSKELLQPNVEKSKMAAFIKKAVKSAAEFNSQFMRELREDRKAYYDLQTQDIQFPLGRCKRLPKEATKVGAYPVAVIPGQYQDYYKKYSSHELKYFPLNSAIYGPPKKFNTIFADPNEPTDSESEGSVASHTSSGSGSGSDTGSSSPSSNQETPMDTSAAPDVTNAQDMKPEPEPEGPKCKMCEEVKVDGQEEELVICSECKGGSHPSCLELTPAMVDIIKTYPWQCMECKTCVECMDPGDEDKMMFCDQCDRGYHTFCVGLQRIPGGKWECHSCRKIEAPTPIKKKRKYERKPKVEDGEDNEEKATKKVKREKKEKKETPVKVKKERKEKEKVTKANTPVTEKKERKRRERKEKPIKE